MRHGPHFDLRAGVSLRADGRDARRVGAGGDGASLTDPTGALSRPTVTLLAPHVAIGLLLRHVDDVTSSSQGCGDPPGLCYLAAKA